MGLGLPPCIGTGQYFVEPDGWAVGDANSTYQAWNTLFLATGNTPDAGYTGDFRVQWSEVTDSSFDQLRVDSMIAPVAFAATGFIFTPIPEPSTLVFFGLASIASLATRRRLQCLKREACEGG